MTIVTRPGITQTLQQARREREKARMQAVAELEERRNGADESIGRLNKEFQAGRHARGRVDTRTQAREMADRVFGNEEEST
jgi:hypothetical protein